MSIRSGVHKKGTITLTEIINSIKRKEGFRNIGAVATFIGIVREKTQKGAKVQKLELEAYEEKANEVLAKICDDLKKKEGVMDVQIHHLLGKFDVGEDLVYVMVAGSHRKNVFSALKEAVERYKKEAPIFKKEYAITQEGKKVAYWTEEKEAV